MADMFGFEVCKQRVAVIRVEGDRKAKEDVAACFCGVDNGEKFFLHCDIVALC